MKQELLWREFSNLVGSATGRPSHAPGGNSSSDHPSGTPTASAFGVGSCQSGHPLIDAQLRDCAPLAYLSTKKETGVAVGGLALQSTELRRALEPGAPAASSGG